VTSDHPPEAAPNPGQPSGLPPESLRRRADLSGLPFETTEDLEGVHGTVGQERAVRALSFGVAIRREGFHVYALGPDDTHKREIVRDILRKRAADEPVPDDLCFVNDFERGHRPRALRVPAGRGRALAHEVDAFLEGLTSGLRAAFESEEYQVRRQSVAEEAGEEQQEAFEGLQERARERDLTLMRTPTGFAFAPVRDGDVIPREELEALGAPEREAIEKKIEEMQEHLRQILRKVPGQQREIQRRLRELNREVAGLTVRDHLDQVRSRYEDLPQVREVLDRIQADIVEHVEAILGDGDGASGSGNDAQPRARPSRPAGPAGGGVPDALDRPALRRYRVNVVVDHAEAEHAPVVHEDNPTYQNLVGRIEYQPVMGAMVTDFNLIRAGALHRANGGYLVLDVRRIATQPLAWEGLKRALRARELRLETPQQMAGMVSTLTLEPEPVPLDVKVVLLGDAQLYYLLSGADPDFRRLFKVEADFDDRIERSPDEEELYARLLATMIRREGLRPFDRPAVERVVERGSRLAGDQERLSVRTDEVLDLMREAEHWAADAGEDVVRAAHVQQAIDEWTHRSSRVRDRMQEEIQRETVNVATDGEVVGQVNGLAVLRLGGFSFGRPSRITARVRLAGPGRPEGGEITNIEREVELSGPLHSKGVLILSSFLGARYAAEAPLALSASLVFEQSYSGIDGDSASSTELYALLSAIGEVPIRQGVAVTGAVSQHGAVQAIGGVNEKVEGFFDICRARGLTGEQGVLVPTANVKHMMLRPDVVQAVEDGRFHVWAVDHVDRGMEILTGLEMGERGEDGRYSEGTINRRVADRLEELALRHRAFFGAGAGEGREASGA
jgi:lon-related putative ATP-dependent protease